MGRVAVSTLRGENEIPNKEAGSGGMARAGKVLFGFAFSERAPRVIAVLGSS